MPNQILPASDRVGITIGNDKKVVGHGGNGVVVMVRDDDAVVLAALPDQRFYLVDIHRINLRKRLVQNVERGIAQQHQVEFGQTSFAAGESLCRWAFQQKSNLSFS